MLDFAKSIKVGNTLSNPKNVASSFEREVERAKSKQELQKIIGNIKITLRQLEEDSKEYKRLMEDVQVAHGDLEDIQMDAEIKMEKVQ